jgi:hypothetical protein
MRSWGRHGGVELARRSGGEWKTAVRPRIATARTPLAAGLPAGGGRGLSVGEARRSQLAAGRVPRDDGAGLGAVRGGWWSGWVRRWAAEVLRRRGGRWLRQDLGGERRR